MGDISPVPGKPWEEQLKLRNKHMNRGSAYPPMSIEPFYHERQRLSGQGMTPEERALRKQWIQSQYLSPNEPRTDVQIFKKNIFRRAIGFPWKIAFGALHSVVKRPEIPFLHVLIPKLLALSAVGYFLFYQLKYNGSDWTKDSGWYVMYSRKPIYDLNAPFVEKQPHEFYERGFNSRKVLLNEK